MSREILAFGLFAALASVTVGALWLPLVPMPGGWEFLHPLIAKAETWAPWLAGLTALTGLIGIFTSVMIYVDTRRPFWGLALTVPKFYGGAFLLGSIASALIFAATGKMQATAVAVGVALGTRVVLFLADVLTRINPLEHQSVAVRRATRTVERHLPWVPETCSSLFTTFLLACAVAIVTPRPMAIVAMVVMVVTALSSMLIERFCFFATCPAPRMPGGVTA
jgi:DMSO reductase anchor subunit